MAPSIFWGIARGSACGRGGDCEPGRVSSTVAIGSRTRAMFDAQRDQIDPTAALSTVTIAIPSTQVILSQLPGKRH
jgi:hypothetical protein